ncbi:hypothetical protein HC766_09230 [Candidatus Gracilibacteria bacterium]|nr:hypothetical protein [Candidatus Gracilibacteria bacterium]
MSSATWAGRGKRRRAISNSWLLAVIGGVQAMTESVTHYRRIDRLKAQAYELGLTNTDAKEFGKLSKTATWESLLNFYEVGIEEKQIVNALSTSVDTPDWTNDGTFPVCNFDAKISNGCEFPVVGGPAAIACLFLVSIGCSYCCFQ